MTTAPYAFVDRSVTQGAAGVADGEIRRLSELAQVQRLVLLGEPGSGKSTAFAQAAAVAGTQVVSARDFVDGAQPPGTVVFIDALEEYRIGDHARDRLADLAKVLKASPYTGWRIACRAISLPPEEVRSLELKLGVFETWFLQPLLNSEIRAILAYLGESDPTAFAESIHAMAAGPLMGNPATLKLLRETMKVGADIATRGQLLQMATYQMAHEINPDFPDLDDRPPARDVLDAAEVSSLVLLVSAREDLWDSGKPVVDDRLVTREHLREAMVDTLALRTAINTPLFVGAGARFHPTHRIVAEYLAGGALARATDPAAGRAALTVDRALALLCGAGNRPAPALTGVFAWFVCALSKTRHAERALELLRADPESIVFHGDAAMMPPAHRLALLDAVGRRDPWFLSHARGATAMGGLAGEDIAQELIAVALDPAEEEHRRILVLEALSTGRPVRTLATQLMSFAADPTVTEWFRRRAIEAVLNGDPDPDTTRRLLLAGLATEPDGGPILLRLHLLAGLIGRGATAVEVRAALQAYGDSGDGVMGYLRPLSDALEFAPIPDLFDVAFSGASDPRSRGHELIGTLERILAATIIASPDVAPSRLVTWVANLGAHRHADLKDQLRDAIAGWIELDPDRPQALLDAIVEAAGPKEVWSAGYDYVRLVGRQVPEPVRQAVVGRFETEALADPINEAKLVNLGELAARLTRPAKQHSELSARVMAVLSQRPKVHESTLTWVNNSEARPWEADQAAHQAELAEAIRARRQHDRAWIADHADAVRSGSEINALVYAATLSMGYHGGESLPAEGDRLDAWFGTGGAALIREGWEQIAAEFPISIEEMGKFEGQRLSAHQETIAVAYMGRALGRGEVPDLPLRTAFAIIRARYVHGDQEVQKALTRTAVERILRDEDGRQALLLFWTHAIEAGATDLPDLSAFEEGSGGVAEVLEPLLAARPDLPNELLLSALGGALRRVSNASLGRLARAALATMLPVEAHQIWSVLSYFLDPVAEEGVFDRCVTDPFGHHVFERFLALALEYGISRDAEEAIVRDATIARRLGADLEHQEDRLERTDHQQVVAGAIARLAASPLANAGAALEALQQVPNLSGWEALLRSQIAMQSDLRRALLFAPPDPEVVARALAGGPPANAADLRAVLREVLADLSRDILIGPTSPWRGFWNRPYQQKPSPKIENDCRDLLTDRLVDRLLPYRIKVSAATEHRSQNDRRVDLVFIGEGEATVPIEAKRHWNDELWTAVGDQLVPYSETLKTSGHGIYLIFWFGDVKPVPTPPADVDPISSAETLRAALVGSLPDDLRDKIDVVVLDVAHQETSSEKEDREKAEREAVRTAAGQKPRRDSRKT